MNYMQAMKTLHHIFHLFNIHATAYIVFIQILQKALETYRRLRLINHDFTFGK